jgi:hypothetical protein
MARPALGVAIRLSDGPIDDRVACSQVPSESAQRRLSSGLPVRYLQRVDPAFNVGAVLGAGQDGLAPGTGEAILRH